MHASVFCCTCLLTGDPDRLVLPDSAAFRCCRSNDGDTAPASLSCYLPFKHVTDAVRQQLLGQQADSGSSSHTILKRAVWRRQLTRECSHYLAPILGKDAAGTVLLVGEYCRGVCCRVLDAGAGVAVSAKLRCRVMHNCVASSPRHECKPQAKHFPHGWQHSHNVHNLI